MARPNFYRAGQRVEAAAVRFNEFGPIVAEAIARAQRDPTVITIDRAAYEAKAPPEPLIKRSDFATQEAMRDVRRIGGEVVNHLRVALDYIAYDLAWLDSGQRQERTSWPMQDTPVNYGDIQRKSLRGVSPEHRAVIRSYQPFEGCEWASTLSILSNRDKHAQPIGITLSHNFIMEFSDQHVTPDTVDPSRLRVDAQGQTIGLVLDDGRDAGQTLTDLIIHVAGVVNRFRGEIGKSLLEISVDPTPSASARTASKATRFP